MKRWLCAHNIHRWARLAVRDSRGRRGWVCRWCDVLGCSPFP